MTRSHVQLDNILTYADGDPLWPIRLEVGIFLGGDSKQVIKN